MIRYAIKDNGLQFTVRVVPRALKSEIAGEQDGALRVRIAAPPVDGAANEELTRTLAKAFDVPVRAIRIITGHGARTKQIFVHGAEPSALLRLAE